jgi:hypothetical protein
MKRVWLDFRFVQPGLRLSPAQNLAEERSCTESEAEDDRPGMAPEPHLEVLRAALNDAE